MARPIPDVLRCQLSFTYLYVRKVSRLFSEGTKVSDRVFAPFNFCADNERDTASYQATEKEGSE